MEKYLKKEIKNNIIRNYKKICKFSLLMFLVLLIVVGFFGKSLFKYQQIEQTINNYNYSYVVESKNKINEKNVYYKINNLLAISSNNKRINTNAYFEIDGCDYDQTSPLLTTYLDVNEIAISKKIANNLDLKVGDYIYADFYLSEGSQRFYIKEIFEYITDFYNFDSNKDFSVVKFGCNEELIESYIGKYFCFMNDEEIKKYNGLYMNIYNIFTETEKYSFKVNLLLSIYILFFSCLLFIIFNYIKKIVFEEIKKYYRDGYGAKRVNIIKKVNILLYCICPSVFFVLGLVIYNVLEIISCITLLLLLVIIIIENMYIIFGDKKYEKAN